MFERKLVFVVLIWGAMAISPLWAQNDAEDARGSVAAPAGSATVSTTVSTQPILTVTPAPTKSDEEEDDDNEKPNAFKPNWSGNMEASYANQNTQGGQGQITEQVLLTGDYHLTEGGHYLSFALGGGQQMLEGVPTDLGTFSVGGGLGLGFFQPSLDTQVQEGAQALISITSTLTLEFQVLKPVALSLTLAGGPESHQGAVSQLVGKSDAVDEIDSYNLTPGGMISFTPWDILNVTLTGQDEFSTTYQYQNVTHTVQTALNQTEQIPSATLGANVTCFTDFLLALSYQLGEEIYPAGVIYSPIKGKTVKFGTPTTQGFTGFTLGLTYNL
ncbi:MAG TPA: hypothetical protein VK791_09635 [bacterium]|jgi:hypothetical protein|nr:hypothetical protein [bacterium]